MLVLFGLVPTAIAWWRWKPDAATDLLAGVGIDLAFLRHPNGLLLPALAGFALFCLGWLLSDRTFVRAQLWNWRGARPQLCRIGLTAAPLLVLLLLLTLALESGTWLFDATERSASTRWLVWPGTELFGLPRFNTRLWAFIMVFYPVVSVWPQEVIYRAFFFHRYRCVLPRPWMRIFASAAAFGFMHILFLNPIAPLLTFIGGVLFGHTYERSRSVLAVSIEHAIYGCWVFTVGLGAYFYGGTVYMDPSG